jgi:hypothetical protein
MKTTHIPTLLAAALAFTNVCAARAHQDKVTQKQHSVPFGLNPRKFCRVARSARLEFERIGGLHALGEP